MTPHPPSGRDLKRALRAQRRALRRAVAASKREARARVDALPAVQRARRRRRLVRAAGVACLLLLALLLRCECEPPPPPPPPGPAYAGTRAAAAAPGPAAPPEPLTGRVKRQPRGRYEREPVPGPTWLEDFHLQVSARSPRLARCFTGAELPGALRWAAALNARTGVVSDHALEPLGTGGSFTTAQRDCVVQVLSQPAYRLDLPKAQPLPDRVSLVIEF